MKANELRLGNLVCLPAFSNDPSRFTEKICADFGYTVMMVNSIIIRDAEHYGESWAGKPIPLTEEWLIKFGFEKKSVAGWVTCEAKYYATGDFVIESRPTGEWVYEWDKKFVSSSNRGSYFKHVHELQNLYFALTGEELKL